jgi:hypothetical protein
MNQSFSLKATVLAEVESIFALRLGFSPEILALAGKERKDLL